MRLVSWSTYFSRVYFSYQIKSRELVLGYLIEKELSKEPILFNETVRKNYNNRANYYLGLIVYFDNLNKYVNYFSKSWSSGG